MSYRKSRPMLLGNKLSNVSCRHLPLDMEPFVAAFVGEDLYSFRILK